MPIVDGFMLGAIRTIAIAAFTIGLQRAAHGGFDEGARAHKMGDFAQAFKQRESLAQQGDAQAQYDLAWTYANGEGVP
jgi:TPR repeat protein